MEPDYRDGFKRAMIARHRPRDFGGKGGEG